MSSNVFSKLTYLKGLRGHDMSNGAYRVLLAVFNYTDEYGNNAHPGEQRLADDTGLSARSVRDYLKWLTENGYLVKGPRGHGNGQGQGFATVYGLGMPELPAESRRLVDSNEVPTGEIPQATGEISPTYRQDSVDLPAKSRPLSDPSPDPLTNPFTSNPPGETAGEHSFEPVSPPSMPLRIVTTQMFHDSPDEFLPDDCTDCKWHGRACGRVREPALASVGAAESVWNEPSGQHWTQDEPPF
ncbi:MULTISPECIES: helix-turn-helix domain-containing protein [Mycobacterium]|uniref:helix-turn-helix domain-containing protein n=1 Tax=Mycobacterium TaxID=1763 RepID=UPI00109EB2AA|nr:MULTISPECIES: helix-turn-helix domain-containing protein [Mycobacterium]